MTGASPPSSRPSAATIGINWSVPWAPRCGAPAGSAPRRTRRRSRSRRLAWPPPFDPRPLLGPPASDLLLVAFAGAAGGPLRAPVVAAQQPPHMPGVVADPGEPPDDLGDARQGPLR